MCKEASGKHARHHRISSPARSVIIHKKHFRVTFGVVNSLALKDEILPIIYLSVEIHQSFDVFTQAIWGREVQIRRAKNGEFEFIRLKPSVLMSQNSFDHLTNCALVSQKTFISSTPSPFLVSAGSTLKKAKMTKPADSIYTFFDIERQDSNSCAGGEFLIDVIDSSKSYLN